MNLNNLDDAEKFQRHFVTPLVEAVRAEVKPLVENDRKQQEQIDKLKAQQSRALLGLSGVAALLSVVVGLGLDWIKRKIGL